MIGFGFASHWLKIWRESFKPITERSNRNHVTTFDSHLKTALSSNFCEPQEITIYTRFCSIWVTWLLAQNRRGQNALKAKISSTS